jgi:hypothetical protein
MNLIMNRKGNVSFIRLGIGFGLLGILVIIGGIILFNFEQQRFGSPLDVDLYPGATDWGERQTTHTSRELLYLVTDASPSDVARFYDQKMVEHYDTNAEDFERESCERFPRSAGLDPLAPFDANVEAPLEGYAPGSGLIPYYFKCEFSETGIGMTGNGLHRSTTVTIQPGVPERETEGMTVIIYEQNWQP